MYNIAKGTCPVCQEPQEFGLSERPRILNFETVSLVLIEHSGQTVCVKCGVTLQPAVMQIGGTMVGLVSVPKSEEKNKVILPGNGVRQ